MLRTRFPAVRTFLPARNLSSTLNTVTLFSSKLLCSTTTTPVDDNRARLEALARARMEEAAKQMPAPRSFERGDKQQPAQSSTAAGTTQSSSSSSNSEMPKSETRAVDPKIAARLAENEKAMPPPRRFERTIGNNSADNNNGTANSEAPETKQQQQQQQKQETASKSNDEDANRALSGGAAAAGNTVMFDVPEGELPRQASYDPWKILGLKPGTSGHDLRVRYHELLEQYHPDYVKDGTTGDVQKWADIDRAYQLVTKAPTMDKRYRSLISDTQYFYYRYLPEWMSRNIDEMPRWWTWLRWRFTKPGFIIFCLCGTYFIGKLHSRRPILGNMCAIAFVIDVLCNMSLFPVMFGVLCLSAFFSGDQYDLSWLTSPRQFLRRPLQY